jgi:hypothetical protein
MTRYSYAVGDIIDKKYKVEKRLGQGAFSEVYVARGLLPGEQSTFVLKILLPLQADVSVWDSLEVEADILDRISTHPRIARLYGVDRLANGELCLKLEYIPGETLEAILEKSQTKPPLTFDQTRLIILQLLEALEYMHNQPETVLHRDIKPSNLILSPENGLVIIDFNVGKILREKAYAKISIVGTPPYIPPEVFRHEEQWDASCDLYAVGVLLYQMLTGEQDPFTSSEARLTGESPINPREYVPEIPETVVEIVLKAIAYKRAARYQSAEQMREDILRKWYEIMPTREYVEAQLNKQLQAVDQALDAGQWSAVTGLLETARRTAAGRKTLRHRVEQKEKAVQQQQQAQIGQWLQEVETDLADPEAESFDAGRFGALLDKVLALAPDNDRAARLRERLAEVAWQQQERRIHRETLQRCEALWGREQEMVANNVAANEILETCYRAAVRLAEQAAADYPESVLLGGLVRRATIAYNQARDRYEARTTAEETGDWRSLIQELEREKDRNKLIPWRDVKGQEQPPITVAEALREAEKLAINFAEQKATEYLQEARQHMAAHAPRAAKAELLKSHDLFKLDQETEAQIRNYLRDTVEPAIQELGQAEKLLRQATAASEPETGWGFIQQAIETYAWVPGVREARQALLPRLADLSEQQMQESQAALQSQQPQAALPLAEQAVVQIDIVVRYAADMGLAELEERAEQLKVQATTLLADCRRETQLTQTIDEKAAHIASLLPEQIGTAVQQWKILVEEYGEETIARFAQLLRLRRKIETHSDVSLLLGRLESAFASNNVERIQSAIADIDQVLQQPERADFRPQLTSLQEKLQLRLDYLTGLETLHTSGDAEMALQFFSRVAQQKGHPDASAAQNEAEQIRSNKELEAQIDGALLAASDHLKASPKRPRQAYELLQPFQNSTSLRRREIDQLASQARQAWEAQLVNTIAQETKKTNPHPDTLKKLISELSEDLPEPRPVEVINQARASEAAARARLHEKAKKWELAVKSWQEAQQYDALNPDYKLGWQRARKKEAEVELDGLDGDEAVRGLFEELEKDIPLDPELRLWQAQYYERRARRKNTATPDRRRYYALAQDALAAARDALERAEHDDRVLQGKIADLSRTVAVGESLAYRQAHVERNLAPTRSLREVSRARQEADDLLTEQRQNTAVADWWQTQRDQVIENLIKQDKGLDPDQIWDRFDVRCKILTLNPDHALAQQLLRDLPVLATEASQRIDRLVADREGLLLDIKDKMGVVEAQQRAAASAMNDGRATYDMLQSFKEQIADPAADQLARILRQDLEGLQGFVNELEQLHQLKVRAQSYLEQARIDGRWNNFEQVVHQINGLGFNTHRTAIALRREREELATRRQKLTKLRDDMLAALSQENFSQAQRLMSILENDEELGDPRDQFGLMATIQATDPYTGEPITNWRVLRNWLRDRQQELETVNNWLIAPENVVAWSNVEPKVNQLVQNGRFKEADDLMQQVLVGNEGLFDKGSGLLALEKAVEQLNTPPTTSNNALSRTVIQLLERASKQLEEFTAQLKEIHGRRTAVNKRKDQWDGLYVELVQALQELEAESGGLFAHWRNKEQILKSRARVLEALIACREVAPNHPSLVGLQDHPLLKD